MTDLERCDREIATIQEHPEVVAGTAPAWIAAMGEMDWRIERSMIEQEEYERFLASKRYIADSVGFEPGELNAKLFPFQKDIVRWAVRRGRACVWADCGLGKTPMQLEWARLVSEHSNANVLILAPLAVAKQTKREGKKFGIPVTVCRTQADVQPGINVTNYEMLSHFERTQFRGLVLDECFPAGTRVDTISIDGSLSMRYIEDIRVGDRIYNAVGMDTITKTRRTRVDKAVAVTTQRGRVISSANHPYFTSLGWIPAGQLQSGDLLMETGEAMRLVQQGVHASIGGAVVQPLLRDILLSEMADDSANSQGSGLHGQAPRESYGWDQTLVGAGHTGRATSEGTHREVEPHGLTGHQSQDDRNYPQAKVQAYQARRKRPSNDEAAKILTKCSGRGMETGVRHSLGQTTVQLPNLLQGRSGVPIEEVGDRAGRAYPSIQEGAGSEEGCDAGFVRVDRVEILELGHPELERFRDAEGQLYFYDLTAERHPSFSVNGLLVHNSSCIKDHTSKTRAEITEFARDIHYRLACTATPAPNDLMELTTHAELMGVMTRAEMLTTFFCHDGGETSKWRLKRHAVQTFHEFLASFAVLLRRPSDLGYDDEGFVLPPLEYHEHVVKADWSADCLFPVEAKSLMDRRRARRDSLDQRVKLCADLVNASKEPWIIWCDLNDESAALTDAIIGAAEIKGADSRDYKEQTVEDFALCRRRVIVSKPSICGWGLNWQHCRNMAFVGLSDSYEALYQATRRCWRFGQEKTVHVHIITGELEGAVVANIKRKEAQAQELTDGMLEHMKAINTEAVHGQAHYVDQYREDYVRAASGEWELWLGDSVKQIRKLGGDSIHYSIFSPPFASLYTYTSSERDMGNTTDDAQFMEHYCFLVKELYRVLMPGRLLSFHCMDLPLVKERDGEIGLRDFRGELIRVHQEAGFILHSQVTIWKDPVTAMQRTKALGLLHKQIKKDSCMSRQGIPDYLVTMRKPGVNSKPVAGQFEHYVGENGTGPPKGSTGERFSIEVWQRYASPVWMDINPSDTLQRESAREQDDERHICPLQLQVIERALDLWTNEGDIVLSPFAGIGSEGYIAVKTGRRFLGIELKESYWKQACLNLQAAEAEKTQVGLFDSPKCGDSISDGIGT